MPSSPPPPSLVHAPPPIDPTSDPLAQSATDPTTYRHTDPSDASPTRRRSTAENILSAIAPPTFTDPLRPQRNFANLVGLVATGISNGVRSGVQAHRDFNASREVAAQEHQAEKDGGVEDSKEIERKKTLEADESGDSTSDRDHSGEVRRRARGASEAEGKGKTKSTVYGLVLRAETMLRGDPQTKQSSRQAGGFGMSVPRHASTSTSRDSGSTSQVTSVSEACAEASQMPQEEAPPEYDASLPSYRDARRASGHPVEPVESTEPDRLIDPPPAPVEGDFLMDRYRPSPPPALPGYLPVDTNHPISSPPATAPMLAERERGPPFPVVPTHDIGVPTHEVTTQLDGSVQFQARYDVHHAFELAT